MTGVKIISKMKTIFNLEFFLLQEVYVLMERRGCLFYESGKDISYETAGGDFEFSGWKLC